MTRQANFRFSDQALAELENRAAREGLSKTKILERLLLEPPVSRYGGGVGTEEDGRGGTANGPSASPSPTPQNRESAAYEAKVKELMRVMPERSARVVAARELLEEL
jgi:hypothetical protein